MAKSAALFSAAFFVIAVAFAFFLSTCSVKVDYGYRKVDVASFSHEPFQALLKKYVDEGGKVDYATWKTTPDDMRSLDEYVNVIANASPETYPDLFPSSRDALAYWINAYNALVIRSVLERWPIASVTDVKTGVSFFKGQGFFANRKFLVGGKWMSLYTMENSHLRRMNDPRVHFAINCASGSCPILRNAAYTGPDLDERMDRSARDFINNPSNVHVSDENKTVTLSMIFSWYEEDFLKAMDRAGATMLDYLLAYADASLSERLTRAKEKGYAVKYFEYDWSVNGK